MVVTVLYLFSFPLFFFFNDTAPTEIYTLSLHDALPISAPARRPAAGAGTGPGRRDSWARRAARPRRRRSEEHTSELQSLRHLVCRLLLEKKKKKQTKNHLLSNIISHSLTKTTTAVHA